MKRLWRSVIVLACCLAAVIGLKIYLGHQIEIAKAQLEAQDGQATVR